MMADENINQELNEETAVAEATEVSEVAEASETSAVAEASEVSEAAETTETATDGDVEAAEEVTNPNFKWYVVHTYSGYENRAKQSLEERIRQEDMVDSFGELLIPTENVVELGKGGQKKTTKRKFFPGYMLVQMELNEQSWHLVRGTPKVTGFVGGTIKPPAIPEIEVRRLTQQIDEGALQTTPRVHFEYGEDVRVIDGAFQNFNGVVEAVDDDKAKVKVMVSIFGRSTPVELDFIQVEKS